MESMLMLFLILPQSESAVGAPKVEVKTVSLDALTKSIKASNNKLTVAYCWAAYDATSRVRMPKVLQWGARLQKKSAAMITIDLDPESKNRQARIANILTELKATGPNFILDETAETWSAKLAIRTEPAIVIFDRNGKRAASFDSSQYETFDELLGAAERTIDKLLAEK